MTVDKILIDRFVVEQALEALTNCVSEYGHRCNRCDSEVDPEAKVASALRAALEQPVEQEPFAVLVRKHSWHLDTWDVGPQGNLDYGRAWADERINVYTHPQNLNCKSTQHRLATLWGYEKKQPRQPLTDAEITELADAHMEAFAQFVGAGEVWFEGEKEFARAIERAHGIGGE